MENQPFDRAILRELYNQCFDYCYRTTDDGQKRNSDNIKKRMSEFLIVDCGYSCGYRYGWDLYGDAELYIYAFPKGIHFSLITQNPNEMRNIKDNFDVLTLNNLYDLGILIDLRWNGYFDYCDEEYGTGVDSILSCFGNKIPRQIFGFERFEEVATYTRTGNESFVGGYKNGFFFFFEFYTS